MITCFKLEKILLLPLIVRRRGKFTMQSPYLRDEQLDMQALAFYDLNYDLIVFLPIHFSDITYIGNQQQKICRFCGKSEPEVSFKNIAHIIPECTGNHVLASNYECDTCNKFFGRHLESEYSNYFSFYHNAAGVSGKRHTPHYQSNNMKSKAVWKNIQGEKAFVIRDTIDNTTTVVDHAAKTIRRVGEVPTHIPMAVFKCLVKMAISIMPPVEVCNFKETIAWITTKKHSNFYSSSTGKKLFVRYRMIPGFNVTKFPCCQLFRRKASAWRGPYMLFLLTYGCFSYLIEVPTTHDATYHHVATIPFPVLPFVTHCEGLIDLSSPEKISGETQSIEYQFIEAYEMPTQEIDPSIII